MVIRAEQHELAKFDEIRRAGRILNRTLSAIEMKARFYRGGGRREDTCDQGTAFKWTINMIIILLIAQKAPEGKISLYNG